MKNELKKIIESNSELKMVYSTYDWNINTKN
jgi:hypothetical protein